MLQCDVRDKATANRVVCVCCSVLQCAAASCLNMWNQTHANTAVCVCCSALQCVAVCCSVLQSDLYDMTDADKAVASTWTVALTWSNPIQ